MPAMAAASFSETSRLKCSTRYAKMGLILACSAGDSSAISRCRSSNTYSFRNRQLLQYFQQPYQLFKIILLLREFPQLFLHHCRCTFHKLYTAPLLWNSLWILASSALEKKSLPKKSGVNWITTERAAGLFFASGCSFSNGAHEGPIKRDRRLKTRPYGCLHTVCRSLSRSRSVHIPGENDKAQQNLFSRMFSPGKSDYPRAAKLRKRL